MTFEKEDFALLLNYSLASLRKAKSCTDIPMLWEKPKTLVTDDRLKCIFSKCSEESVSFLATDLLYEQKKILNS